MMLRTSFVCVISIVTCVECRAFIYPTTCSSLQKVSANTRPHWQGKKNSRRFMSENGQFDLSKPSFDVLSFRQVPADVLLQYDATNQSEPLRITIYGLLALGFFIFPSLAESLVEDISPTTLWLGCAVASISSAGLFIRECSKRNQQLVRLEKERAAGLLQLKLPDGIGGIQSTPRSLKDLTRNSGRRVLVLGGNSADLSTALSKSIGILRKRLAQASVTVVAVGTDGSTRRDWNLNDTDGIQGQTWLAEAYETEAWVEFLKGLASTNDTDIQRKHSSLIWFALNARGRSIASGTNEVPRLLELLGSFFPPTEILDQDKVKSNDTSLENKALLDAQSTFYRALTTGDKTIMKSILSSNASTEVSEVVEAGGQIDDWEACLAEGARPEGMVVSECEVSLVSNGEAYTTCIEFPLTNYRDSATLLAIQKWSNLDGNWKLQLHQTIPWTLGNKAGGTLRCDVRGCVALERRPDKRTFGGLIG